jgi:hypothetical protein
MVADPGFWDWKIGDDATWAAAIGSVLAAVAAFKAARDALRIANDATKRESTRYARRAEVHAANILHAIGLVYLYVDEVLPHAVALCAESVNVPGLRKAVDDFYQVAEKWQELIGRIDRDSVAELPDECAAATAGAISEARMTCVGILACVRRFQAQGGIDQLQRSARLTVDRCYSIRKNLEPYNAYVKAKFGADLATA